MSHTKTVNHLHHHQQQAATDQRCWLCNSDRHLATRCEDRCRNSRCAGLKLRTHTWAECPFKTRPFCQLCGDTDHGVFERDCIHRCYAHDKWVHHIDDCPTRCDDCGVKGHTARSRVCSLKRDRRPMNLLDVAAFKVLVPVAVAEAPQQAPKAVAAATASPKKPQQQQPSRQQRQQAAAEKRKVEEARRAKKEMEEKMRQALAELEKEKERILKELVQLQSEEAPAAGKPADLKKKQRELGQVGRKTLKQSRG
jgi:hypothetical protein